MVGGNNRAAEGYGGVRPGRVGTTLGGGEKLFTRRTLGRGAQEGGISQKDTNEETVSGERAVKYCRKRLHSRNFYRRI